MPGTCGKAFQKGLMRLHLRTQPALCWHDPNSSPLPLTYSMLCSCVLFHLGPMPWFMHVTHLCQRDYYTEKCSCICFHFFLSTITVRHAQCCLLADRKHTAKRQAAPVIQLRQSSTNQQSRLRSQDQLNCLADDSSHLRLYDTGVMCFLFIPYFCNN